MNLSIKISKSGRFHSIECDTYIIIFIIKIHSETVLPVYPDPL